MNTIDLIEQLESMSGLNEKKELLALAFRQNNREFFTGAKLALNKLVSFGVKKVPRIDEEEGEGNLPFSDFMTLANRLRNRELTGHAARDAMIAALEISDVKVWNKFYRRILLKDLKVNVGASMINSVLLELAKTEPDARDYMVPVFECQLAEDSKKHPKKIKGKKLVDIKLDGARMLTILDIETQTVRMFTRSGAETDKFPHIAWALESMLPELPMSVVLDGEILSDTFQGLMTQFQRKDADTKDMKLGLFDIIPLSDFVNGFCAIPQKKRHETLCEFQTSGLLQAYTGETVYVIPKLEVDLDTPTGHAEMKTFFNQAVSAGFEGIMIKDPDAPYEGRKWSAWLKWKPSISVSLTVTGIEQGNPDSEFAHTLGALVCEGVDDVDDLGSIKIKAKCGSGFPIKVRDEWWADPTKIVGWIVEIEADAATLNQNATDVYSLRFPRFKGLRGTKPGEKI